MDRNQRKIVLFALVMIAGFFFAGSAFAASPSGANVTSISNSTAPVSSAGTAQAYAGNVSEISLSGVSTTQAWQGYYGNVTGAVRLADGSGNVLYNWSVASPTGEVYASTNSSITWTTMQCFNFTASGTQFNATGETPGSANLKGMNLTQLQNEFGISSSDSDSVNNTFTLTGAGAHATFYTANIEFNSSTDNCQSTRVFDNTGAGVSGKFEEVLLYDPTSNSVVFTSLLNKDALGFDNKTHDFENLVLENGHGSDTATTPYYFFVELQ